MNATRNQIEMPDSWSDDLDAAPEKPKFPRELAIEVANELEPLLVPFCERIAVAGSVRRGKAMVGDLEILFISRMEQRPNPDSLFGEAVEVPLALEALDRLVSQRIILPRPKRDGTRTWGSAIRLAAHCYTTLPVDFFRATEESWFNLLVCRTGGAQTNMQIASRAKDRMLQWNPSIDCAGFTRLNTRGGDGKGGRQQIRVTSEEDVFRTVGLECPPPHKRR
jgi:DNA polymerase/3'-5' exonuclease PolX